MTAPIISVDDDTMDLELLRMCHEAANIAAPLLTFNHSHELLKHMDEVAAGKAPPPRAILIDVRMPQIDGFELVERLRASHSATLPRVVFLTSSARPDDAARAAALGGTLVTKPDGLEGYVALLRDLSESVSAS